MTNPLNSASSGAQASDAPASESSTPSVLSKVLVYDTLCSVYKKSKYKDLDLTEEEDLRFDPPADFSWGQVRDAPRNSIIGYNVSDAGQIKTTLEGEEQKTPLQLYYPLFSSHFSLPVKPGEYVFVLSSPLSPPSGYWLTRIAGPLTVEDANYSILDRQNIESGPPALDQEKDSKFRPPGFPNGRLFDQLNGNLGYGVGFNLNVPIFNRGAYKAPWL